MSRIDPSDIFPKKPFSERYELIGTLSNGDREVSGLQVVLQYSLIKAGDITASVVGDADLFSDIKSLADLPHHNLRFNTTNPEFSRSKFTSDSLYIGANRLQHLHTGVARCTANLEFLNLTMVESLDPRLREDRQLILFLAGPKTLWPSHQAGERSYTGEEKNDLYDSLIELSDDLPFTIETRPHYFYDETTDTEKYQLKTNIQTLCFTTTKPRSELSDAAFIDYAISVADDLILLISFISRRWVGWFRYKLITPDAIHSLIRRTREYTADEIDIDDGVISFPKVKTFLRSAFTRMRSLRESGIDLKMPLVYYISGNESRYFEGKFSTLFLSLENIKDYFCVKRGLDKLFKAQEYDHLSKMLKDVINKECSSHERRELILQKLPELNRPALRSVLDILFKEYNVEWADLYPPGSDLLLLDTRNKLFHSSQTIDHEHLFKEILRMQALLERLYLSMLDWPDQSNSPRRYQLGFLKGTNK